MDEASGPVTLRPLAPEDSDAFATWAADAEFRRRAEWDVDRSVDDYRSLHRRLIEAPPPDLLRLGVVLGGALVGYVDLRGNQPQRWRELGFAIGERSLWGRGLGRSAAAAALDHAFGPLRLTSVRAEAADANEASIRILRGLGMVETRTGAHRTHAVVPTENRRFAITAERWLAGREQ